MSETSSSGQKSAGFDVVTFLRGLGGALVGAAVGLVLFTFLLRYGVYAMAVPGALVGVACGWSINRRSLGLGIVCAAVAATNMILAEWWNFPFRNDKSLTFFLLNLGQLSLLFWLSLLLGCGLAFAFGQGSDRTSSRTAS